MYDTELTLRYLRAVTIYNQFRKYIGKPQFDLSKSKFSEFSNDQKLSAIQALENICKRFRETERKLEIDKL